jgi:predicted adenylyl cyclase CyaB
MDKNIEVETKSFISKSQYYNLLKFFKKNGKFLGKDNQTTYYLSGKKDLRIQKGSQFGKLCLKYWKEIHDDCREEMEIKFDRGYFEECKKIFSALGYTTEIKWIRIRNRFLWKGTKVSVDSTKGYGYILELERMSDKKNKDKSYQKLISQLEQLKVDLTPKREFEKKFKYYKKNWPRLIKN